MLKTIRCPKCNHKTTIEGNSEEIKNIQCPNCGLKGKFTFPKEIENSQVERFGSPKRIRGNKMILYFGIALSIVAILLFILGGYWSFLSYIFGFFGIMCVVAGYLGIVEERKKQGIIIKSTTEGVLSLVLGLLSVFSSLQPIFSTILGIIAIVIGIKSVKAGDNLHGYSGLICGIVGVSMNLFFMIFFRPILEWFT